MKPILVGALFLFALASHAVEPVAPSAYAAMKIPAGEVLNGTVLSATVLGGDRQVVALVTYLTGNKDEVNAVNVRLEVFRREGASLVSVYARDYGSENGGLVGRGELELVDLDGDDVKDIFVEYDDFHDKLITLRRGEILTQGRGTFRTVWTGAIEYDATKAAREIPAARRDRFSRRLDVPASLKTRGLNVVFGKTTTAVAGERLTEPKMTREAFPWKPEEPAAR